MVKCFKIHFFYPDGGPPESGEQLIDGLSEKWLKICNDLLEHYGPVINHNMGSTLSHFDIRMGGPIGTLLVNGNTCFEFAISLGQISKQDRATTNHFKNILLKTREITSTPISESALNIVEMANNYSTLLLFDSVNTEVNENDKEALIDLGVHLAGAYFQYCELPGNNG